VDEAFGVPKDTKNHTRAKMTLGIRELFFPVKQKVIIHSSTEAELVSVDEVIEKILWPRSSLNIQVLRLNDTFLTKITQAR